MVTRFSSMIGIINTCVKTGVLSCEVPTNKLCINVLRILRNQGYIWGFNFVSPQRRKNRLYPRVKILFKYANKNTPTFRAIEIYKNTRSNYYILRGKNLHRILAQNKLYLLSTPMGLSISSLASLYNAKIKSTKMVNTGKILAELLK